MNSVKCSTSDTFFTINNKSISVKRSNFISVFLKAAYHAIPGAVRKRAWSSLYISRHIFESSQIH